MDQRKVLSQSRLHSARRKRLIQHHSTRENTFAWACDDSSVRRCTFITNDSTQLFGHAWEWIETRLGFRDAETQRLPIQANWILQTRLTRGCKHDVSVALYKVFIAIVQSRHRQVTKHAVERPH